MTSAGPYRLLIPAMSVSRCGSVPGRVTIVLPVPNTAWVDSPRVLAATEVATIMAATATVSMAMMSSCWRHSRRNSRTAQRITARRATMPLPGVRVQVEGFAQGGAHRVSLGMRSDSGPGGRVVWPVIRPSRKSTIRSAQAAS